VSQFVSNRLTNWITERFYQKNAKEQLEKPFTIEEITEAIRKTPNKATGPSGTPITLFKIFDKQLSPILCEIANDIATNGESSVNDFLLDGNVIFIPKKKESQFVKDLRPITLLEIPRKIITKVMTERMKKVLLEENIINKSQYCHPGRKIHENVLSLKLIIESSQNEKEDLHAMFVDFSKAFDRVNHYYIKHVLEKKNFGERAIRFINTFLKGFRKVDFNGSLSESFMMGRGIPQGETLSPFLFALALDPLLNKIENDQLIDGIKLNNQVNLKSLAYADDISYLSRKEAELSRMLKHTQLYCKASNALISVEKSELLSFGNKIEQIDGIKQATDRVRHLGFFVNQEGFINNIDDLIGNALVSLNLLKRRFICLTVQIIFFLQN
jgi:hypothetical protein